MHAETPLLIVTPTYARPLRLSFLKRCAEDFRAVANLFWIVVEDGKDPAPDVAGLLSSSGVANVYLTCGPTRAWGNEQRNRGLEYIRDRRLEGVIYLADDDNKYQKPLFDELRKIRRVGVMPVGCLGPWGIERPIINQGRIVGWDADWKSRMYPVDMAGFGFNAELLAGLSGDLWAHRGDSGESQFIERLVGSANELEILCNDCRDCYVWHNVPLGWSTRQGLTAYMVRRRAPGFLRKKLNYAFKKFWLKDGTFWSSNSS
jgi:glycosyl transferase family 43